MQEYLENAKKTISSITKKAVKKSSEVYENTKISFKISGIKSDIEDEYVKIGRIVYQKYKGNDISTDDAESICAKIDSLFAEIEELNAQLAQNKNINVCPTCGAENLSGNTFCANCGEKL